MLEGSYLLCTQSVSENGHKHFIRNVQAFPFLVQNVEDINPVPRLRSCIEHGNDGI